MMGQLPAAQNALFYQFCIEHHVPANHPLRGVDAVLDLGRLRTHLVRVHDYPDGTIAIKYWGTDMPYPPSGDPRRARHDERKRDQNA